MPMRLDKRLWLSGRSPLGLRGLKLLKLYYDIRTRSRSPLGLRGLKLEIESKFYILQKHVAAHSGCVD